MIKVVHLFFASLFLGISFISLIIFVSEYEHLLMKTGWSAFTGKDCHTALGILYVIGVEVP